MVRLRSNPKIPEGINSSDENPLKEFAWLLAGVTIALLIAVFTLSLLAEWLAPSIPFRWEQRLTGLYDTQAETPLRMKDSPAPQTLMDDAEQAVQDLGAALVASQRTLNAQTVSTPPSPESLSDFVDESVQYRFHLLSDATPNAFATLGGHIFVTTGLLRQVSSENALAMVMAHEMAHITERHPIQALSRGALVQFLLLMVMGGQGADAVGGVLGQAGLLTILSFNRDMERDADGAAINLLLARYGHLDGADEFFQNMLVAYGDVTWSEWAQTHPGVGERLSTIQSRNPSPADVKGVLTPLDSRLIDWLQQKAEAEPSAGKP